MRNVKKLMTLAFSAVVVSSFLVGCQGNHEHPTGDNQSQEQPAAGDKAGAAEETKASEAEHPTSEHPTGQQSAEEQPN